MSEKIKTTTVYAICNAKGVIIVRTIRYYRKDAILAIVDNSNYKWNELKKHGYSCKKFTLELWKQ